jgi:hypothetical protein
MRAAAWPALSARSVPAGGAIAARIAALGARPSDARLGVGRAEDRPIAEIPGARRDRPRMVNHSITNHALLSNAVPLRLKPAA